MRSPLAAMAPYRSAPETADIRESPAISGAATAANFALIAIGARFI